GAAPGTPIEAIATLDVPPPVPASMDELIDLARRQRPERASLVKRVAAAAERNRAAAAGTKPNIGVGGGFDYARPNARIFPREDAWRTSWDAGVNVSWPLLDGGRTRGELAEASAAGRAAEERLAEFDSVVAVEIRQRMSEIDASRAAIAAANDAVRSAREARRVVGDRFAAGVTTSTDVLDAQVALLQAALDRTQAIAAARLADARLRHGRRRRRQPRSGGGQAAHRLHVAALFALRAADRRSEHQLLRRHLRPRSHAARCAPPIRARYGGPRRPGAAARRRSRRRVAPAARRPLRDPSRAARRLSRRADPRRGSRLPA